ncbi:MAG: transposase [Methylococcaceae bacterium]|nr:transposase [Methylococcaceae bacterium]
MKVMQHQHQTGNASSLAFVIMPDHQYWLFSLHNQATLAEVMRSVKGRSAQQIQQSRRHRGEITAK